MRVASIFKILFSVYGVAGAAYLWHAPHGDALYNRIAAIWLGFVAILAILSLYLGRKAPSSRTPRQLVGFDRWSDFFLLPLVVLVAFRIGFYLLPASVYTAIRPLLVYANKTEALDRFNFMGQGLFAFLSADAKDALANLQPWIAGGVLLTTGLFALTHASKRMLVGR